MKTEYTEQSIHNNKNTPYLSPPPLSINAGGGTAAKGERGGKQNTAYIQTQKRDPCNENQLDAVFILSLFRQSTATCFGHICGPSSGGILCVCVCVYIYIYIYMLYLTAIG
jgi:hypothetical protein